jgi:hypothetical protein
MGMRVDKLAVYCPDGMKAFESALGGGSEWTVEECGVEFYDSGAPTAYVKDKGERHVFVGFPFWFVTKDV